MCKDKLLHITYRVNKYLFKLSLTVHSNHMMNQNRILMAESGTGHMAASFSAIYAHSA